MGFEEQQTQQKSTYFIDPESATEMARLNHQDQLVTTSMGGLFPDGPDLSSLKNILDIACGPGGWALEVARTYPTVEVVGVDISQRMIALATTSAQVQGLSNALFQVMDVTRPLDFPDASFDLVNARLLTAFMPRVSWQPFVNECTRILRPGGVLRLTESDTVGTTNSPALERLHWLLAQAVKISGLGFSPDGRTCGITPMLGHFLLQAGCHNLQQRSFVLDYSVGTPSHNGIYQNAVIAYQLALPFLLKTAVTTSEEFDQLYHLMEMEMLADDFRALWYFLSAWAEK
jgi:ubiquinone/menaquinone biosynthesis C-methylase UbiE